MLPPSYRSSSPPSGLPRLSPPSRSSWKWSVIAVDGMGLLLSRGLGLEFLREHVRDTDVRLAVDDHVVRQLEVVGDRVRDGRGRLRLGIHRPGITKETHRDDGLSVDLDSRVGNESCRTFDQGR